MDKQIALINNPDIRNERAKKWAKDNSKRHLENTKRWQANNKERHLENRKKWREANRDRLRKYDNELRLKNLDRRKAVQRKASQKWRKTEKGKITASVSHGMWRSLRQNKSNQRWENLVEYSLNKLIKRLKSTIPDGYTWTDFLNGKLHLDHKIPISAFNFSQPEHIDFKRCWALSNLQLLPAQKNQSKNDKLIKPFQPSLAIG